MSRCCMLLSRTSTSCIFMRAVCCHSNLLTVVSKSFYASVFPPEKFVQDELHPYFHLKVKLDVISKY